MGQLAACFPFLRPSCGCLCPRRASHICRGAASDGGRSKAEGQGDPPSGGRPGSGWMLRWECQECAVLFTASASSHLQIAVCAAVERAWPCRGTRATEPLRHHFEPFPQSAQVNCAPLEQLVTNTGSRETVPKHKRVGIRRQSGSAYRPARAAQCPGDGESRGLARSTVSAQVPDGFPGPLMCAPPALASPAQEIAFCPLLQQINEAGEGLHTVTSRPGLSHTTACSV
ncbi:hypothetical protein SKAU_G00334260 [Synaphobranchus kaupii]|uniref:Uncharacterized protein n=1 Tax=Synaphobranchus kaupii TaxID=118154 RepID=A0A9Q1ELP5_SYNKA|nr:hypothetical protein SKAU_G00334260 [Synaphobranchus kaupii]